MWLCSKCGESVEDSFDVCWKCGTSWDGVANPKFQDETARVQEPAPVVPVAPATANPISCLRCKETLQHAGTRRFHEGTNWGVLGELGELFVKRERFDVYACPGCGHVEFFVDGVGEEHRPA